MTDFKVNEQWGDLGVPTPGEPLVSFLKFLLETSGKVDGFLFGTVILWPC